MANALISLIAWRSDAIADRKPDVPLFLDDAENVRAKQEVQSVRTTPTCSACAPCHPRTCAQIKLKLDYKMKLKFLLSTFSQNGTWLGFQKLEDQFWYVHAPSGLK